MPSNTQFSATNFLFYFPSKKITFFFELLTRHVNLIQECLSSNMKISGFFAASMAAASASAALVSASSSSSSFYSPLTCNSHFQFSSENEKGQENSSTQKSSLIEKFSPRFDGLRFIETLITAHR